MVVTAALFAPAPARAQDVTSAPLAAQLNVSTYVYWSDQHRYGCPPASLRVYVADYPGEQGGSSYQGACAVWIDRGVWNRAQGWPLDPWLVEDRRDLWAIFAHERGHELGLGHWPATVMDPCGCVVAGAGARWARGQ